MFGRRVGRRRTPRDGEGEPGATLRHTARDEEFRPPAEPDEVVRGAFDAHVERFLGSEYMVWHEIGSETMHLDVYMWDPTPERPYLTCVTSGMSDVPMNVPDRALDGGATGLVELMVCLPPEWPTPREGATAWRDEQAYFPVRWLKDLARLPSAYDTWLGFGHSVPNGDPAAPLAEGSAAVGWVLLPPMTLPAQGRSLSLPHGRRLDLFALIAVTAAELDRKLRLGVESLFDGFDAAGVNEVLDIGRASTV